MDNILSIIVVLSIILYSVIAQVIKDKRIQERRMLTKDEEEELTPFDILREIGAKQPEVTPKQQEGRVEIIKQIEPIKKPKITPKKSDNHSKSGKKVQEQPTTPEIKSSKVDFDVERAVIEAEILRPKYLDY